MLRRLGADVIAAAATVEEARAAAAESPHGVLLDFQLADGRSADLARDLRRAGVQVILSTGYDCDILPEDLRSLPRLTKPVVAADLRRLASASFCPATGSCDGS